MDPLFVPSLAELKANLRLSQTSSVSEDFETLFEQAVRKARLKFRQRLGQARINVLISYTQDSPHAPDEDREYFRDLAEITEIDIVKFELTYILPMLYMDGAAGAREVYQEEGAFRKADSSDLEQLRKQLNVDIEANLKVLSGIIPMEQRHTGNFSSLD